MAGTISETGGKTTVGAVGVLVAAVVVLATEVVILSAEIVVVVVDTVEVAAPTTVVQRSAITVVVTTLQGLKQGMEGPNAVRAVGLGTTIKEWWLQLWGRSRRTQGWRERPFPRWQIKILQLVHEFERRPEQVQAVPGEKASDFLDGYCLLRRAPEQNDRK